MRLTSGSTRTQADEGVATMSPYESWRCALEIWYGASHQYSSYYLHLRSLYILHPSLWYLHSPVTGVTASLRQPQPSGLFDTAFLRSYSAAVAAVHHRSGQQPTVATAPEQPTAATTCNQSTIAPAPKQPAVATTPELSNAVYPVVARLCRLAQPGILASPHCVQQLIRGALGT
ncbi:hypothetical protein VOLCADRAFT_100216 [Volvox carteri f. nagariensis]|uniref:Uncharacterized protein n=1 Tax=Volvox carteri f. nagariensis TaxID=3068 RepID=D8UJQ5_VOLCA|nr:uncharacterized protein VOLCADRAFT_100216 [Volvox carteri f. nagariensis]EFJ40030.1 hypothetical protein VOLCADRAFT_100216 [Volvox carteri f. nagariensis]|eukprot:XP_002958899.1 hypothetical protein VOLCADRAFT_100216 [Volvox carteri f. nagariensis]